MTKTELGVPDAPEERSEEPPPTEPSPAIVDASPSEVVTVDEAAAMLRLDRKTVYAAIARDELPGVRRIGRAIRISRHAVDGWLKSGGSTGPQLVAPRRRTRRTV